MNRSILNFFANDGNMINKKFSFFNFKFDRILQFLDIFGLCNTFKLVFASWKIISVRLIKRIVFYLNVASFHGSRFLYLGIDSIILKKYKLRWKWKESEFLPSRLHCSTLSIIIRKNISNILMMLFSILSQGIVI